MCNALTRRKLLLISVCSVSFYYQPAFAEEIVLFEDMMTEKRKIPRLPNHLDKLVREHSSEEYFACDLITTKGEKVERVYLYSADSYLKEWGVWPEKNMEIPLSDVLEIVASKNSLPIEIVQKIIAKGETGMGYSSFTLIDQTGLEYPVLSGNLVNYIALPSSVSPNSIVDLRFDSPSTYIGSNIKLFRNAPHKFCLYA